MGKTAIVKSVEACGSEEEWENKVAAALFYAMTGGPNRYMRLDALGFSPDFCFKIDETSEYIRYGLERP